MAIFTGRPRADDRFIGTSVLDTFNFAAADLNSSDVIVGGDGGREDRLILTTAASLTAGRLAGVSGVEAISLADGINMIILSDRLVASAYRHRLLVEGADGSDTIDASGLTAFSHLTLRSGLGDDVLKGGAGHDAFEFSVAGLTRSDLVAGGAGVDTLRLLTAGAVAAGQFAGIADLERIILSDGGNQVQLVNAVIGAGLLGGFEVLGGAGADVINGSRLSAAHPLAVDAGAGDDQVVGGLSTDFILGGAGADRLDGGGGDDMVGYDGVDLAIAGGLEDEYGDTLLLFGAATINLSSADQSIYDTLIVSGFEHVDASASMVGVTVTARGQGVTRLTGGEGADRLQAASNSYGEMHATGGGGADTMYGSWNNDEFYLMAGDFEAGEHISGGGGYDSIHIMGSNDLTQGYVSGFYLMIGARSQAGAPLRQSTTVHLTDKQLQGFQEIQVPYDQPRGTVERVNIHLTASTEWRIDFSYVSFSYFRTEDSFNIIGREEADFVTGLNGAVYTLHGNGGDDILYTPITNNGCRTYGDEGNDRIEYQEVVFSRGSALMDGGTGNDTLFGSDLDGPLQIDLRKSDQTLNDLLVVRNFENVDFWADIAGVDVIGSDAANKMIGTNGADRLNGGAGDDVLDGGRGEGSAPADDLIGGLGRDRFQWSDRGRNLDRVADFVSADDVLGFDAAAYKFNGQAFDTRVIARSVATSITGADLVCYTAGTLDTVDDAKAYLAAAAGGTAGAGIFLVGENSAGDTVLFHATDASFTQSQNVAAIATLGSLTESTQLLLSDFQFI
jgi:Ca2+-binding RTX toxin-like protein